MKLLRRRIQLTLIVTNRLGTAIYVLKTAAENWRQHGNLLGTNEIMGLYMSHDLIVLGVSDGVLCASTGFGLLLQKLIYARVISWNRHGWIIQSVSRPKLSAQYCENGRACIGNIMSHIWERFREHCALLFEVLLVHLE